MKPTLRRSFLHFFALTAATGLLASGCTAKAEKDTAVAPPEVPVVTLKTSTQTLHRDYVADVQAVRNVEVRAQVAGFLEHIYVDEGKPVKKGQPLFRLNASAYRNKLSQAQAAVASAQAQAAAVRVESDRVRLLVDKNVIAKTELKLSDSKIREADARVALPLWQGHADAWYLDGFSPAKNPELWGEDLMAAVARHTRPDGTFATYTAAGHVRRALAQAGFTVTRAAGFGTKRHMSTGVLGAVLE